MYRESLEDRCVAENRAVNRVKEALRITINWQAPSVGVSRKLESVRFIVRALKRHLERKLALEESGGYMIVVYETRPSLLPQTQRLRRQHDTMRSSLAQLLPSIERLRPTDEERFEQLCEEIAILLQRLERHELEEADLLQEALLRDDGGEG